MIIRGLDADHDWVFGKGKQSYNTANDAISENIQTRLLEFLNDCFFNMNAGIDWLRLLGTKKTKEEIVLSCKAIILKSEGVVRVNRIDAALGADRRLSVSYNIDTIYTRQFIQNIGVPNA